MRDRDKMSSALETLQKSRNLIQDINSWCQGEFATDDKGNRCSVHCENVKRWSAVGALWKTWFVELKPGGGPYFPFWQEDLEFADTVIDFCAGLLDTKSLELYKAYDVEFLEYCGHRIETVNEISPYLKPKETIHRMVLAVYDAAIKKCSDELELRAMLFR